MNGEPGKLQRRHLSMISIGGIIGSGLFVGSSAAIAATGPAIVVSYALAGILILYVMRMLGELAMASPRAGAFSEHIRIGLGNCGGFVAGWLYWLFWALAIALEALAGGTILTGSIGLPAPVIALVLIILMTGFNLLSTRSFGEVEFWLSSIKVAAILLFVGLGLYHVGQGVIRSGAIPAPLTMAGGFVPFGPLSILSGMTAVVLALVGAEIVTIAAVDSDEPGDVIARLTTTLIVRIMLFYVLSMLLIVAIVPWPSIRPGDSPFALALAVMGVPGIAVLMNGVVLVAVLSCLNSGVYVCSRVMTALVDRGEAPASLGGADQRGVPVRAILTGSAAAALAILLALFLPMRAFAILVNATGAVMLIVYLMLVAAHAAIVRRRDGRWPQTDMLVGMAMIGVLVAMGVTPDLASQAWGSVACAGLLFSLYQLTVKRAPVAR